MTASFVNFVTDERAFVSDERLRQYRHPYSTSPHKRLG